MAEPPLKYRAVGVRFLKLAENLRLQPLPGGICGLRNPSQLPEHDRRGFGIVAQASEEPKPFQIPQEAPEAMLGVNHSMIHGLGLQEGPRPSLLNPPSPDPHMYDVL